MKNCCSVISVTGGMDSFLTATKEDCSSWDKSCMSMIMMVACPGLQPSGELQHCKPDLVSSILHKAEKVLVF